MNPGEALARWDAKIVDAYLARRQGLPQGGSTRCVLALQPRVLRLLDLTLSDVVARTAAIEDEEARNTISVDALRSASVEVALQRYMHAVSGPKPSPEPGENRIANQIEQSLMLRVRKASSSALHRLELEVPTNLLAQLDTFLKDQISERLDEEAIADWPGDLLHDVRSSLAEAVALEWIERRDDVYPISAGSRLGTRPAARLQTRLRQRRRGHREHSAEAE